MDHPNSGADADISQLEKQPIPAANRQVLVSPSERRGNRNCCVRRRTTSTEIDILDTRSLHRLLSLARGRKILGYSRPRYFIRVRGISLSLG